MGLSQRSILNLTRWYRGENIALVPALFDVPPIPEGKNMGQGCLVQSTDFTDAYEKEPPDSRSPIYSYLMSVTQTG